MMTIDWPSILADLAYRLGEPDAANPDARTPCGERTLAGYLGVPRGTLRGWMEGSEPRHADGELLLVRWCVLTGKDRSFAPTMRGSMSASGVR